MRKFHRKRGQRRLFVQSLLAGLIMRGRIETTLARAKELRPLVERLTTVARRQTVAALRLLRARLPKDAAAKLYYDVAPKYQDRRGGYTRIVKLAKSRKRDAAQMAIIEFI